YAAAILLAVSLTQSLLTGCSSTNVATPPASASKSEAELIEENLAKLSPEDRKSAELQKNCLVADAPLGTMGPPVKVKLENRDAWICCAGCSSEIEAEPAKYLEKLTKLLESAPSKP
ncbi:MAG: hypothetical protein ACKPEY_07860, partial [Planctomycetota bacterium]